MTNLVFIGKMLRQYNDSNGGNAPIHLSEIEEFQVMRDRLTCPTADAKEGAEAYHYIPRPMFGHGPLCEITCYCTNHRGGAVILFSDMSVIFVPKDELLREYGYIIGKVGLLNRAEVPPAD